MNAAMTRLLTTLTIPQIAAILSECGYVGCDRELVGESIRCVGTVSRGDGSIGAQYTTRFYNASEGEWQDGRVFVTMSAAADLTADY